MKANSQTIEKYATGFDPACRLFLDDFLFNLLFDTEDGGSMSLRNASGLLPRYKPVYLRRQ
jgi:hypothetical protein